MRCGCCGQYGMGHGLAGPLREQAGPNHWMVICDLCVKSHFHDTSAVENW